MIITSSKSKKVAQERKFNYSIPCDPAMTNSSTMIMMKNLNVDLAKIDNITNSFGRRDRDTHTQRGKDRMRTCACTRMCVCVCVCVCVLEPTQ